MHAAVLTIHLLLALALILVVLLQRSEGGGLVSGGTNSMISVRGTGDLLTRITWILATVFFVLGLLLTIVAGRERGAASVVDRMKVNAINPAELNKQLPQPPAGATPTPGAPAPLQAPAPTLNSPFGVIPAEPAAPAPAPAQPTKK